MIDVLLMYGVFILYFLIPLIPAVVIYKLFPKTEVTASGPLSGLNIKTKGAFAAYIIALIFGIFIINKTINTIEMGIKQKNEKIDYLWQVKTNLKVVQDDSTITNETSRQLLDKITVAFDPAPNWNRNSDDGYISYVPNSLIEGNVTLTYSGDQCETKKINPNASNYKKDIEKKEITIGDLMINKTKMKVDTYKHTDTTQQTSPPPNIK